MESERGEREIKQKHVRKIDREREQHVRKK